LDSLQKKLFEMQDLEYKSFHSKLIPTVPTDKIIGIRTPLLRKFAKEFSKTDESAKFLESLPHKYYEENNLHTFIIQEIKDYSEAISRTETFLPFIDNWATCDSFTPKVFKQNKPAILKKAYEWIDSNHSYTIRYGIKVFMDMFLDEDFSEEHMKTVSNIKSDEYYVKMMVAWYFATAFAKQYTFAVKYIENNALDLWTHNKSIQKAVESYRIDNPSKEYLKTLKRKSEAIK